MGRATPELKLSSDDKCRAVPAAAAAHVVCGLYDPIITLHISRPRKNSFVNVINSKMLWFV